MTIGECERALRALKRNRRHRKHKKMHAYRCCACAGWHVSSMTEGEHEERAKCRFQFHAANTKAAPPS